MVFLFLYHEETLSVGRTQTNILLIFSLTLGSVTARSNF